MDLYMHVPIRLYGVKCKTGSGIQKLLVGQISELNSLIHPTNKLAFGR